MKKHLYLMPVLALSLSTFALTACDDKKEADVPADTATESTVPPVATEATPEAPAGAMVQQAAVQVTDAYSFATAEGATTGAVFATLHNAGSGPDLLTGASTDVAGSAEIHQSYTDPQTGTMEMRKTSGVDVVANQDVKLEPSSYHVMLLDLKKPLVEGETFNVTLTFRDAGEVVVPVTVTAAGAAPAEGAAMTPDEAAPVTTTTPDATATISEEAPSISGDEEGSAVTTPSEATTPDAIPNTAPVTPADDATTAE